jgi:AraC family transcriptional regulator
MSQQISASQFRALLPTPPETSAAWDVFSLLVLEPPNRASASYSDHVLALVTDGTCRLRRETNGRSVEGWSGPGTINLIPADVESTFDGRGHRGTTRAIALFIPGAFLARVIAQDWDAEPKHVEIRDRFLVRDPIIEGVLTRLALEAGTDSPSGRLYAESACEFLAHHIIHAHSSLAAPPPPSSGGLPARRLAQVLEYIHENLGQPLSLYRLAEMAGVGPRHFERAFRQAVGMAPHAYVIEKRVAAAQHLLVGQPRLSVDDVAARVGFSSASHLAAAVRRRTGHSPREFRALHGRRNAR